MKSIDETMNQNENMIKNEVDILKAMDHPNIVKFYGSFYNQKTIHIIMENL